VALVQVPPRGLWGHGARAAHTSAEAWLGRALDPAPSLPDTILRYLAAFGPASPMDAQTWSTLTRLREVFEALRPRVRTFRDAGGRELFDLPDAPRPDPDTPAPPRFLPGYDNLHLSHADRSRTVAAADGRIFMSDALLAGTPLVDGLYAGAWRIDGPMLRVELLTRLSPADHAAVEAEAAALVAFAAPGADLQLVQTR
jgi:hypothetical protein